MQYSMPRVRKIIAQYSSITNCKLEILLCQPVDGDTHKWHQLASAVWRQAIDTEARELWT